MARGEDQGLRWNFDQSLCRKCRQRIKFYSGSEDHIYTIFPGSLSLFFSLYIVAHVILGNASSIPPRLPFLSPVLRMLRDSHQETGLVRFTMVCCSYRGYWTSQGRPSEKGIAKDAAAALEWIKKDGILQALQSRNESQQVSGR